MWVRDLVRALGAHAIMSTTAVLAVCWIVAVVGLALVLIPIACYFAGRPRRLWSEVVEDPARAQPAPGDRSYASSFRDFSALGFHPIGTYTQATWFLTPINWRKTFPVGRWLASSDNKTLVHCYRVLGFEPVRWSAVSVNDRDGIMLTSAPKAGVTVELDGDDHRLEIFKTSASDLLAEHQGSVAGFCAERGLRVRATSLPEVCRLIDRMTARVLPKMHVGMVALLPVMVLAAALPPMIRPPDAMPPVLNLIDALGVYLALRILLPVVGWARMMIKQVVRL